MRIRSSFSSVVCVLALLLAVVKQGAADSLPIEINFTGRYVVPLFDVIDEGVQICRCWRRCKNAPREVTG